MTPYSYFLCPEGFLLESGETLKDVRIAYSVFGNRDAEKTIWVCHALSGNSLVPEWWGGIFGDNRLFNFQDYRIVCANVLGSCYGSTGPDEYGETEAFPLITIRDMVQAHKGLRNHLGIETVDVLIGASLGGQQAVEWAIEEPEIFQSLILVATNAVHSPLGRAFNESQRLALKADPTFAEKDGGKSGLKAARAIAMLSYRSYEDFELKQIDVDERAEGHRAASYVSYQGGKFIDRFKPRAYYSLSKSMDSHDVGRARISKESALGLISARTLVVGVNSDTLFPLKEQKYLAEHIPSAELGVIDSVHGHDAFLIEYEQLETIIEDFLNNDFKGHKPTTFKTITNRDE